MLELEFTARDLAYTRFAFSPLWEVVAAVRVLRGDGHPLHEPWAVLARDRLARSAVDWRMLADLVPVPTRVIPGFVAPPPSTPMPDLATELATLRATPAEVVLRELDTIPEIRTEHTAVLRSSPAAGLALLCEVIEEFWALALEPWWPRILTLLEGDVLHRARRLTTGGAQALFADLDPKVRWADPMLDPASGSSDPMLDPASGSSDPMLDPASGSSDPMLDPASGSSVERLRLAHRHVSGRRGLRGRGLLLVPSVFVWPRIFSITVPGWQPTLRYPPRGIATLWERRSATPAALAGVLGRSRAELLTSLDSPASTTELARRTGLAAGGVSQHLGALKAAGLVSAHRTGRFVLYARTTTGEALLSASE